MDNGGFDVDPDPEPDTVSTSQDSKRRSAVPRRRVVSSSSPSRHSWANSPPNTAGSSAPPSPMGRCETSPLPSPQPSPPSPDMSPVRYNPVSRNHSLKYSGGA